MDSSAVKRGVAAYFAAIRAKDAKAVGECFAEDAVVEDPYGAPARAGRRETEAYFEGVLGLVQKIDIAEQEVYASGGAAAVRWSGEATSRSGARAAFEGIDVFEFDADGRIRRLTGYWDPAPLMGALAP